MTTTQLLTRLGRVTRPEKLRNFWNLCHDSQYAGRLDLEQLRSHCQLRATYLGVVLPVIPTYDLRRETAVETEQRVRVRQMTATERRILEGSVQDRHPDFNESGESFTGRRQSELSRIIQNLPKPKPKKRERKLPPGMRLIRLKKKNVRQMTIDEILELD